LLLTMVTAVALAAVATGACSGTNDELLVINRSGRPIALWPGVTVGSCEQLAMTREQITAANERWSDAFIAGEDWVPPGALQFTRGMGGAPIGAPDPMVVVISSEAEPQIAHGAVPPDLPACGGDPVGIE
jgi:hypothetical protein